MGMGRRGLIVAALCIAVGQLIGAAPASAETRAVASITSSVDHDHMLWFSAALADDDGTLRIKIFAPKDERGHRRLWQVCRFKVSGPGTYRCGIDVAPGSLAFQQDGEWTVKASIDSRTVAVHRVSL